MNITVFGANGRVGRLVVTEALKRGHHVKAFVHGQNPFDTNKNLEIVQGDIYTREDVANALSGSDSVISTLGSWGTPKKDILTTGMRSIIPEMERLDIQRIVSLTGAGCKTRQDSNSLKLILNRLPLLILARKVLKDGENHIHLLESSSLTWTVLRSPVMNNSGNSSYKLSDTWPMPWSTINRTSVAEAMVDILEQNIVSSVAPFIRRS
jgi:putative NADH-flavin reductase